MCLCKMEEQTSVLLLTNCSLVESSLQVEAMRMISICNMARSFPHQSFDQNCAILNCSRDPNFIKLCVDVVENKELNLREEDKSSKELNYQLCMFGYISSISMI